MTKTTKTEPKRFTCRECGKRTHLGERLDSGFFCEACYEAAGVVNDHQDGNHSEPVDGCSLCTEEAPATTAPRATREAWLLDAVEALRPMFEEVGFPLPERVAVSVGFPGGGSARKRIGECWAASTTTDEVPAIFLSPTLADPVRVLDVLVHELIHALGKFVGHDAGFASVARSLGLEGKPTATVAGEALLETLRELATSLGEYGHGAITLGAIQSKKQGTRMLKVECANGTGYKVRMTRTWLDDLGAPSCPCCGEVMLEG